MVPMADPELETFAAECPLPDPPEPGGPPAPPGSTVCDYVTRGWPTQAQADTRLLEHMLEHRTGKPAPELAESAATANKRLAGGARSKAVAALREARNDGRVTVEPDDEEAE